MSLCMMVHTPDILDILRLFSPSIAASNERMVSSGRSRRGLVGFERSGSASLLLELFSSCKLSLSHLTDWIAMLVIELHGPKI